jgi:hypothetical protein
VAREEKATVAPSSVTDGPKLMPLPSAPSGVALTSTVRPFRRSRRKTFSWWPSRVARTRLWASLANARKRPLPLSDASSVGAFAKPPRRLGVSSVVVPVARSRT